MDNTLTRYDEAAARIDAARAARKAGSVRVISEAHPSLESAADASLNRPAWFSLSDWHAATRYQGDPPERQWLVQGVFPMGKPSLVAAAGGVGKSFSLLSLAREVADGSAGYMNRPILFGGILEAQGAAVLVTSEDDSTEVHSRLMSMGPIPSRLFVVSLPDAGGVRPLFQGDKYSAVFPTPAWEGLAEQLRGIKDLRAVILDPLQPLAACDLNDAGAAQAVCSSLAALASETGAAVIVSHHFSKQRDIETPVQAREAVRGSGALVDGVRCAYALWPAKESIAKSACKSLGRDWEPDAVILGAVVKANGKATREVRTFVREASGLLVDRTHDLREVSPKMRELLPALKAAIATAAREGKPYTKTGLNGLHARRFEMPEAFHAIGKHRVESWADELLASGEIVAALCGTGTAVKWLDIPDGDVARGTAIFQTGHVKRAKGGKGQGHWTDDEGEEDAPY